MQQKRIGIVLLLTFLLWRSLNSVFVITTDLEPIENVGAGLSDDTRSRIRRALDMPPAAELYSQRYELLRDNVPPNSDLFFLHEFTEPLAIYEIFGYFRMSALLYPCNAQMVKRPPSPNSSAAEKLDPKDRYVLDVRRKKSKLAGEFTKVGETTDSVLWLETRPDR